MKLKILLLCVCVMLLSAFVNAQNLIQGTIKSGSGNSIEVWIKPNFNNSTQYLFQIGMPIAFPASASPQPTGLNTPTLDASFISTFGNNYTVTVNPVATATGGTEKYFNIVLVRGGAGASNPQTWTAGTEYKVLTVSFAPSGSPNAQVKLADYQDGGSDGQGNFYTQDGNNNYYVSTTSVNNFYAAPSQSTTGGNASAGYAQTIQNVPCSAPVVPPLTGGGSVTVGGTIQLSNAVNGGTFSSDLPGIASVNPTTGAVLGVALGTTIIRYSVSNSCGTTEVTTTITVEQPLIKGTIKKGAGVNDIEIWLQPNFTNSTQYLFQIGLPIAFPSSANPQPTGLTYSLDASFISAFGNNYTITLNPVATAATTGEKYFNLVLVRGGAGASTPQTWTAGTEFKVLNASFTYSSGNTSFLPKLADYQDGGSDGQGNFYTQDGNNNYYVTANSRNNFYASPGNSVVGGNALAGFAQITSSTLPVTLLNFSGYKDGAKNVLKWTTSTEVNNKGFEVERSNDGISFTTLSFVTSTARDGNSSSATYYSYNDNNPSGKQYYRLRQIGKDGSAKLSNTVLVAGEKPIALSIHDLYPNPSAGIVNLVIDAQKAERLTVMVSDMQGRTVINKQFNAGTGSNTMQLDVSALASGSYVVRLLCNDGCNAATKFVKQ